MKRFKDSYLSYALVYSCYYGGSALFSTLITIYLLGRGFDAGQVSLVVSMACVASMAAQPFAGRLQAMFNAKRMNLLFLALAACGSLTFMFCSHIGVITAVYAFVQAMLNCACPMVERIATRSRFPYGKLRIWGTIGYSVAAQMAGLIYTYISPSALYVFATIAIVLCAIGLWATVEIVPENAAAPQPTKAEKKRGGYGFLRENPHILLYLVISAIFSGATTLGHTYCAPMFQAEGIPVDRVSTILLIAGFCEMPFIFYSYKFMNRLSNKLLLTIIFTVTMAQMLIYGVHAPLALMIAITFIAKHPAAMVNNMINLKVMDCMVSEEDQMPAMSLVYMVRNLVTLGCQALAGQVLLAGTYANLFMIAFGMACVGTLLLIPFKVPAGSDRVLFHK